MTSDVHINAPLKDNNQVSPHDFMPIFSYFNRGRCIFCYQHEDLHPIKSWVPARPIGDKRRANG